MIDPKLQFRDVLAGAPVPASFHDVAPEQRALTEGVGLYARGGRRIWRVTGADAVDYLHRMLTQDIARVPDGGAVRACLLNRSGRVLGDFLVWRQSESCVMDAEAAAADHAFPVLEKFVIADDVVFTEESSALVRVAVVGPKAAAVLADSGIALPEAGVCTVATQGNATLSILSVAHGDAQRFECLLPRSNAPELLDAWLADERTTPVGATAFEAERVRTCEPAQPNELNEEMLFNEAQLESAVSWNKGCYPGQEPVVMAKHRGRPPRLLVGLAGVSPTPAPGAALSHEGREVGVVTSVAASDCGWQGLAFVRHALAESGGTLSVDGAAAEIRSPGA